MKKSRMMKRSCRANNLQEREDDINTIDDGCRYATPHGDPTRSSLLGALAALRKASISFVVSVRQQQIDSH